MEKTPINLTQKEIFLIKGEYEGHPYYKLQLETEEGFKLSCKLTAFEYNTLKATL